MFGRMSKPVKEVRWVLRYRYQYMGRDGRLHWMPTTGPYNPNTHIEKMFSTKAKALAHLEKRKAACKYKFESEPLKRKTVEVCYM